MSNPQNINILNQEEFYDTNFSGLMLDKNELKNKTFENCQFTDSNFNEAKLEDCKFIDCTFKSCNLSNAKFKNTSLSEVIFNESKLIGVDWTRVQWYLTSPFKFYKCNLSHSSFYELCLKKITIEECKAHDVDFRGGDFSSGSFILTDLKSSLFMRTKLYSSDFTGAINYNIDPNENNIRKGKFSMPEVVNLLHNFGIKIQI